MGTFSCQRFSGVGPKIPSVRGNERGNNLLFQEGERFEVRVERRVEKREKELCWEGKALPKGGSENWELEM
jgi:hypothetical protein